MTISAFPPFMVFFAGALMVLLLKGRLRSAVLMCIPVIGFLNLISTPEGTHWTVHFLEHTLIFGKVDKLSLAFGAVYHLITLIAVIYSLHVRERGHHSVSLLLSGAGVGAVFSGDLISLFIFWEIMAVAGTLLVWMGSGRGAAPAGMRYFIVHLFGGLFFLFGALLHIQATGTADFGFIGLGSLASWLLFISFGINCAWPGLHAWIPDAYPQTTPAGAVFMWTFTTKTAVFVLLRAFPGTELLIWIGAVMAVFPVFFALIENNLRRVLAYGLINQLGFMVAGIGIGTPLSINGAVSHVICHILYNALLVMSMGAVLYRTGKIHCTDLGGLCKSMPLTTAFCIVGAVSISGFPLFSGFVSKSMVLEAAGIGQMAMVWLLLMIAVIGDFQSVGIKVPYRAFFAHDAGLSPKEAPPHMLAAMGIAAFFCIAVGVYPSVLYAMLPYPVGFQPYTAAHVVTTCQLLLFGALAYLLFVRFGLLTPELRATNLDADWFYRKGAQAFMWVVNRPAARVAQWFSTAVFDRMPAFLAWFGRNPLAALKIGGDLILLFFSIRQHRQKIAQRIKQEKEIFPGDIMKRWPVGTSVLWVTLFLLAYLLVYYLK